MKKQTRKLKIITSLVIFIFAFFSNILAVKAEDSTQTQEANYEVKIELNTISSNDSTKLGGNKLRVTNITEDSSGTSSEIEIKLFNAQSGSEIAVDQDGSFTNSSDGTIVSLNNLIKNKNYQIKIEDIEASEGYQTLLNSIVLDILVDNDGNIVAKISEMRDTNNQIVDLVGQVISRLHGVNNNGVVTIDPLANDPDAKYLYKIGEDGGWKNYTGEFKVYENTTVYAQATKNGINSAVSLKVINNIDKELPQLESYEEINENNDRYSKISAKLTDNASGIKKYGISTSDIQEPDVYTQANQELELNVTIDRVYENGIHYIWIWDAAGNCAKEQISLNKVNIINVAKITSASEGYENLIGTEYRTLSAAIAACPTTENSSATISIIAEIFNENNTINNRNITLNLNGNTITNQSSISPAITIKENSSLTIINEDENEVQLNNGSITSQNSKGILVEENGTLTLGKNDRKVRVAQPAISGKVNGVENKGTFNFYDGNVTATIPDPTSIVLAIYGRVTDTPVAYSVTTKDSKSETESKQVANPAVIDNIEARIGRKTYTQLETAVEEAGTVFGTDGSQVEIIIVNNLNKNNTVVIDSSKNIKLDLDGHTFTTASSGYVLENYGVLEIVDTSEEQTGEIISTTNSTVYNATIESGDEVESIDLSTIIQYEESNTPFEYVDGILKSTAIGRYGSSRGYFEIDLTGYEEKEYTLNIDMDMKVNDPSNYSYRAQAFFVINKSGKDNNSSNAFKLLQQTTENEKASIVLLGGEKYYLTCNFYKNLDERFDEWVKINTSTWV